jgi:hypothetical protein
MSEKLSLLEMLSQDSADWEAEEQDEERRQLRLAGKKVTRRKPGGEQRWSPEVVAGWRYAGDRSIAETARRWLVSEATVKRYCSQLGGAAGALTARHKWFVDKWELLTGTIERVYSKGYEGPLPAALKAIPDRLPLLKRQGRQTEIAMEKRGIKFTPRFDGPGFEFDPEEYMRRKRLEDRRKETLQRKQAARIEADDAWLGVAHEY